MQQIMCGLQLSSDSMSKFLSKPPHQPVTSVPKILSSHKHVEAGLMELGDTQPIGNFPHTSNNIALPKFSGDDVLGWICTCERIFIKNPMHEQRRMHLIESALEARATTWHKTLGFLKSTQHALSSWDAYMEEIYLRFGLGGLKPIHELKSARQQLSIGAYEKYLKLHSSSIREEAKIILIHDAMMDQSLTSEMVEYAQIHGTLHNCNELDVSLVKARGKSCSTSTSSQVDIWAQAPIETMSEKQDPQLIDDCVGIVVILDKATFEEECGKKFLETQANQSCDDYISKMEAMQKLFKQGPTINEIEQFFREIEIMQKVLQIRVHIINKLDTHGHISASFMPPNSNGRNSPELAILYDQTYYCEQKPGSQSMHYSWFSSPHSLNGISSNRNKILLYMALPAFSNMENRSVEFNKLRCCQEVYRIMEKPVLITWNWYYKDIGEYCEKYIENLTFTITLSSQHAKHPGQWRLQWMIAWVQEMILFWLSFDHTSYSGHTFNPRRIRPGKLISLSQPMAQGKSCAAL